MRVSKQQNFNFIILMLFRTSNSNKDMDPNCLMYGLYAVGFCSCQGAGAIKPGCVFGEPVAVCFQRGSLIRASSCQRFVSVLRPSLWNCQMGKMSTFKPICTETIHHVYYQLTFTYTQTPSLFSHSKFIGPTFPGQI